MSQSNSTKQLMSYNPALECAQARLERMQKLYTAYGGTGSLVLPTQVSDRVHSTTLALSLSAYPKSDLEKFYCFIKVLQQKDIPLNSDTIAILQDRIECATPEYQQQSQRLTKVSVSTLKTKACIFPTSLEEARSMYAGLDVYSNGTNVTSQFLDFCASVRERCKMTTGGSKVINDTIRVGGGDLWASVEKSSPVIVWPSEKQPVSQSVIKAIALSTELLSSATQVLSFSLGTFHMAPGPVTMEDIFGAFGRKRASRKSNKDDLVMEGGGEIDMGTCAVYNVQDRNASTIFEGMFYGAEEVRLVKGRFYSLVRPRVVANKIDEFKIKTMLLKFVVCGGLRACERLGSLYPVVAKETRHIGLPLKEKDIVKIVDRHGITHFIDYKYNNTWKVGGKCLRSATIVPVKGEEIEVPEPAKLRYTLMCKMQDVEGLCSACKVCEKDHECPKQLYLKSDTFKEVEISDKGFAQACNLPEDPSLKEKRQDVTNGVVYGDEEKQKDPVAPEEEHPLSRAVPDSLTNLPAGTLPQIDPSKHATADQVEKLLATVPVKDFTAQQAMFALSVLEPVKPDIAQKLLSILMGDDSGGRDYRATLPDGEIYRFRGPGATLWRQGFQTDVGVGAGACALVNFGNPWVKEALVTRYGVHIGVVWDHTHSFVFDTVTPPWIDFDAQVTEDGNSEVAEVALHVLNKATFMCVLRAMPEEAPASSVEEFSADATPFTDF